MLQGYSLTAAYLNMNMKKERNSQSGKKKGRRMKGRKEGSKEEVEKGGKK